MKETTMKKPRTPLIVWLALGLVIGAMLAVASISRGGASRFDVIDAQVWFETCGEAAGLKGPELKACIDAEKPVPTTEDPAATTTTTAAPPVVSTAAPAPSTTLPRTITPPAPATTADHRD